MTHQEIYFTNKVKNALIDAKITVLDNENKKININGKKYTLGERTILPKVWLIYLKRSRMPKIR